MQEPILITGAARSGTSLTAGIVHICGAFGGKMHGPTPHNRKGMFENATIVRNLVKPYLKSLGVDPMGQNPLPDLSNGKLIDKLIEDSEMWRESVLSVFKKEGYRDGPFFYKGAKMCLLWPLWHTAFREAKWIIVRRATEDIVGSCMRTGFMRAYADAAGWAKWVEHHERCFKTMLKAGLKTMEVWPSKAIKGDLEEMHSAMEWAGLQWREQEVKQFISPDLWRENNGI